MHVVRTKTWQRSNERGTPEQESRLHEMTVQYMHLTGRVEQMEVKVKALANSSPIYTELKHIVSLTKSPMKPYEVKALAASSCIYTELSISYR